MSVCVRPGRKPGRPVFSRRGSYVNIPRDMGAKLPNLSRLYNTNKIAPNTKTSTCDIQIRAFSVRPFWEIFGTNEIGEKNL